MDIVSPIKRSIPESGKRVLRQLQPSTLRLTFDAWKREEDFQDVHALCLFIGYMRSGHTLVGSLLNAHPEMVIAHELGALAYLKNGYSERQLRMLILQKDRAFGERNRKWTGYDYRVAGQYQGRFTTLKVVGDKHGASTIYNLTHNPSMVEKLGQLDVPVRFIHHVRNPYDIISTGARKSNGSMTLKEVTEYLFRQAAQAKKHIASLSQKSSVEGIETHHEALVRKPKKKLRRLLRFLNLSGTSDYLKACDDLIFESPHKSRYKMEFPDDMVEEIATRCRGFDFLDGYKFSHAEVTSPSSLGT